MKTEEPEVLGTRHKYFRFGAPGSPTSGARVAASGRSGTTPQWPSTSWGWTHNSVVWVGGAAAAPAYVHLLEVIICTPFTAALWDLPRIKLANPELKVICHMGDGETSAIGGNHLIQTARRNADIAAICVNNYIRHDRWTVFSYHTIWLIVRHIPLWAGGGRFHSANWWRHQEALTWPGQLPPTHRACINYIKKAITRRASALSRSSLSAHLLWSEQQAGGRQHHHARVDQESLRSQGTVRR